MTNFEFARVYLLFPTIIERRLAPQYNQFMKNNVSKVKADNPGITHKEAFKQVALMWATAKENPKVNKEVA
ncbi:Axial regulator YABBY 5 [Porphyridium purpureum]|uniref:Axial regulator YABBY 5 n=1 Tax=Porphyridium purpureum TaxID=35688 RepID=A0A5J4YKF9_PORPP|nr:Axial regulator YABBY 5 [Porphyridium purpureum]|eukprot:POR4548..scf244_11